MWNGCGFVATELPANRCNARPEVVVTFPDGEEDT